MPEPEDLITDAARHATVYARDLWRRRRAGRDTARAIELADVASRVDLLVCAVFGRSFPLRIAQAKAPTTLLARVFRRVQLPRRLRPVPATDDVSIWLPARLDGADDALAVQRYRAIALQQAMRAQRGSAAGALDAPAPLVRDVYLLLEAQAADADLVEALPGTREAIDELRRTALAARPPADAFAAPRRALEGLARALLALRAGEPSPGIAPCPTPTHSLAEARRLAARLLPDPSTARRLGPEPLLRDEWTGELVAPPDASGASRIACGDAAAATDTDDAPPTRSARLVRRPEVREAHDDEDRPATGAWMVQADPPHEHAEDPFGLQRPVDRDEKTSADEYGDALSELAQARLVSSPGRPQEVLLSDDPPAARARLGAVGGDGAEACIGYPEWDYRLAGYRDPGTVVQVLAPGIGPMEWVERTLAEHRSLLEAIERRFGMLRAHRSRLRRQLDGEDPDIDAYVEAQADFRAGLALAQALYQTVRPARPDTAIVLLVDTSGSTDAWVRTNRRVIDIEREALLLVCTALDRTDVSWAVQAFSGEGPHRVTVRSIKRFDERHAAPVAQRIAALEPEHYTRAGAAIRHAAALLMRQPAAHRLLLLLSDGKPNDVDEYEGRYGVEDMRQAVIEAKAQGISPFCLTIDRQAAGYLPGVFGAGHYSLLPRPELLPTVLLDWMKRLLVSRG